jgi:hypothetical protein
MLIHYKVLKIAWFIKTHMSGLTDYAYIYNYIYKLNK